MNGDGSEVAGAATGGLAVSDDGSGVARAATGGFAVGDDGSGVAGAATRLMVRGENSGVVLTGLATLGLVVRADCEANAPVSTAHKSVDQLSLCYVLL